MFRLEETNADSQTHHMVRWCASLVAYVLLLSVTRVAAEHSVCLQLQPSPALTPFVDPLPIPELINVSNGTKLILGAYKITQKLHRDLPSTTLYAYGTSQQSARYPGPSLKATKHRRSRIRWENHITDAEHIFTVDRTLHWADPPRGGVPMVVHLHGAETRSDYDGHPDAWFTAAGDFGPQYTTNNYVYPNTQEETMLWYHDHTVGITRLNAAAGMIGAYFIKSAAEKLLPLPSGYGTFEIPLIIQDKTFWSNGSINFPDIGVFPATNPNWCPDYYGDTILVNGKIWPYLDVYRTKYRFRLVVGSNARFFNLSLSEPSLRFVQIGTDGGFLPQPITLQTITMSPGYRCDVVIDFTNIPENTTVYMNNSAPAFFPDGNEFFPSVNSPGQRQVMAFRVVAPPSGVQVPRFSVPSSLAPQPNVNLNPSTYLERNLTMSLTVNPLVFLLNNHRFMDPVTESPKLGTTEIWTIYNFVGSTHPIHLHLINFLMLDMQPFNQTRFDEGNCSFSLSYPDPSSCFTGLREPPNEAQVGWKDTVIVYENKVTRLLTRWKPRYGAFTFNATLGPGYVWHCHILDHEDNDMMRPLVMRRN